MMKVILQDSRTFFGQLDWLKYDIRYPAMFVCSQPYLAEMTGLPATV